MNRVETDIEHTDLDPVDDEDTPMTLVFVSICLPDGMRYTAQAACDDTPTTPALADMIRKAAEGAAVTHSPQLGRLVERSLGSPR